MQTARGYSGWLFMAVMVSMGAVRRTVDLEVIRIAGLPCRVMFAESDFDRGGPWTNVTIWLKVWVVAVCDSAAGILVQCH